MNTWYKAIRWLVPMILCWSGEVAQARTPIPDVILYGPIIDRLSNQVMAATAPRPVTVRVDLGGTVVAAYELGSLPEANDDYVAQVPRDDGVAPRIPGTTTGGDEIDIFVNHVEVDGTLSNVVAITANITDVRLLALHVDTDLFEHDNDGLTDICEPTYFGSQDAEPGDDPDGDGFINLEECLAGTDPTDDASFPLPQVSFSTNPVWWSERGVLDAGADPADFAAVNQGQVKHLAKQAFLELEEKLPGVLGGAGTNLAAVINGFSQTNSNYSALNIGQLKQLAKPFYDRLAEVGYAGGYPWTATSSDDDDFPAANIGQVKRLFSFEIGEE